MVLQTVQVGAKLFFALRQIFGTAFHMVHWGGETENGT